MNAILNVILSYHGIRTITAGLIVFESMLFCRYVTGMGPISAVKSVFLHSEFDFSGLREKLHKIKGKTSASSYNNPNYEDISLNGGDGRGTVSEVLAQQTEMKLLNGEEIKDEFEDETTVNLMESNPDDQIEDQEQPTEVALEQEEYGLSEIDSNTDDQLLDNDKKEKNIFTINGEMIFDGFSLGDTYEQK